MKQSFPQEKDVWKAPEFGLTFRIVRMRVSGSEDNYAMVIAEEGCFKSGAEYDINVPKVWFHAYCTREQQKLCECGNNVFLLHGQKVYAEPKSVDAVGNRIADLSKTIRHLECSNCGMHLVRVDVLGFESTLEVSSPQEASSRAGSIWISKDMMEKHLNSPVPLSSPIAKPDLAILMKSSINCPNCSDSDEPVLMSKIGPREYSCELCGYKENR